MTLIIDKKIVTLGRHQQAILSAGKLIPNVALTAPISCSRAVWQGRDSETDGVDIPAYF